ncbi:MAG: hypothetical protein ACYDA6_05170 [Solirubrobacteraceae bacterium]
MSVPFFLDCLVNTTIPLDLAVSSEAHASTVAIVCWAGDLEADGGRFSVPAQHCAIVTVQTSANS